MIGLVIAGLGFGTLFMAQKAKAAEQGAQSLPPNTAPPATGTTSTPSPATAAGGPGAAGNWQVKVDTNAPYVKADPRYYADPNAGTGGIPRPFVPRRNWNGFNAVPSEAKTLATVQGPNRTRFTSNPANLVKL